MAEQQIDFPEALSFLFRPMRFKAPYGGRGSSKSWSVATALLILGTERPLRILCAREYQNSMRDSVHKLLADTIDRLHLGNFYQVQDKTITGANGTEFIFAGLRQNIESIKSKEGVDICWVEEAQTVSQNSWDKLIPTIRKAGSEIWITFNPDLEEDPTYKEFILRKRPNCIARLINYLDNPWVSRELVDEAENLRAHDLDAYAHIWLGECRKQIQGALWTKDMLAAHREPGIDLANQAAREALAARMQRIVVAIDPSGCSGPDDKRSDEVGILVCGRDRQGVGYVIEDLTGRYSPEGWAKKAVDAFDRWKADKIVAEKNFGGALVESNLRAFRKTAPVKLVTASRGKAQRAEPVAALYEQGKAKHVGYLPDLERQLLLFSAAGFKGARSPDRADAVVWGLTELLLDGSNYDSSFNWV